MGLAFPTQRFQDWFTQQWVIIRGRRVDPAQVPWLMGPFGRVGGIGEAFIDQLAEKEGLLIERQSNGLIPSMSGLRLPAPDLARLSRTVRNFYENTANFDLAFSVEWNPLFRAFGVLTNKLFSNRINQLNIPTRNLKDTESLRSEIITLAEPQTKERKYTVWFRTNASNAKVIYSGVYGTCTLPSGKTCVKAVFPLPNGNATVLMTPSVGANGELILDSSGKTFGDAGFYFLLEDSKGNFWAQFVRSFRDRLTVREESDHLTAEQTLTLFSLRVATFRYRIVAKKS